MENKFSIKKLLIIILIIVVTAILSFGLFSYFSGETNNNGNNSSNTDNNKSEDNTDNIAVDYKITSVYQLVLDENEQVVSVNDKNIILKLVNKELYINGNSFSNIKAQYAYVTDYVIIFTYDDTCHQRISYVIDSNANSISFTKEAYYLYDFRILNGNFIAAGGNVCPCNSGNCNERADVELKYTGSELLIK